MKKLILAFILAVLSGSLLAAGAGPHLDSANINLHDKASLQRGARLFVNYCLNCHAASYMRYNRMGKDLGLSDEQVEQNLMFTTDKVGDTMTVAMDPDEAKDWFGVNPPDLSVIARAKGAGSEGADWLYTYLRSFYVDASKPMGVNNIVFKDVGMPHVLWELQGMQRAVFRTEKNKKGTEVEVFDHFELVQPGSMDTEEYDNAIRDLTNFMVYMGEPSQLKRRALGIWVLLFIAIFTAISYALKKEFWKDVH